MRTTLWMVAFALLLILIGVAETALGYRRAMSGPHGYYLTAIVWFSSTKGPPDGPFYVEGPFKTGEACEQHRAEAAKKVRRLRIALACPMVLGADARAYPALPDYIRMDLLAPY